MVIINPLSFRFGKFESKPQTKSKPKPPNPNPLTSLNHQKQIQLQILIVKSKPTSKSQHLNPSNMKIQAGKFN